jgi:hypothetical protein
MSVQKIFDISHAGKMTNKLSILILLKRAQRSEALNAKRILNSLSDAKLCFAFLASFRSAILNEI